MASLKTDLSYQYEVICPRCLPQPSPFHYSLLHALHICSFFHLSYQTACLPAIILFYFTFCPSLPYEPPHPLYHSTLISLTVHAMVIATVFHIFCLAKHPSAKPAVPARCMAHQTRKVRAVHCAGWKKKNPSPLMILMIRCLPSENYIMI